MYQNFEGLEPKEYPKYIGHFLLEFLIRNSSKKWPTYSGYSLLEPGEDIKNVKLFWVSPNPLGVLNQKNLLSTSIYQFEHFGTP